MSNRLRAVSLVATALLFFMLGGLAGCGGETRESLFSSVGSYGDVAVMASSTQVGRNLDDFLQSINPQERYVLKREATYRFHRYEGKDWKNGRNYRNLLYIVRWGDGGAVQDEIADLLSEETLARLTSGRGGTVTIRDPYFRNQLAIVVLATGRRDLFRHLQGQVDAIGRILRTEIDQRIIRDNRRRGLHPGLDRKLWRDYGFSLEIPLPYKLNQERPEGFSGLEFMLSQPVTRGLSVSWRTDVDPAEFLSDRVAMLGMREQLGEALHREHLNHDTLVWSEATVAGLPAVKLAGAWVSDEVGVGGPFRCYFLPDPSGSRVFCADVLVYAPHKEKMDDFRQLHAILETFSLEKPDAAPSD